jgi:hypothetical protein
VLERRNGKEMQLEVRLCSTPKLQTAAMRLDLCAAPDCDVNVQAHVALQDMYDA